MFPTRSVAVLASSLAIAVALGAAAFAQTAVPPKPDAAKGTPAPVSAPTPDSQPVTWKVECSGDGKTMDCSAIQQVMQRLQNQQLQRVALLAVHPEGKGASIQIVVPLGVTLSQPILISVDAGEADRVPLKVCDNNVCQAQAILSDKLLAAMRTGTNLKLLIPTGDKNQAELRLPLRGFQPAFDKARP